MRIIVNARHEDVEIITELDLLVQVQKVMDDMEKAKRTPAAVTEAEEGAQRKALRDYEKRLKDFRGKVDDVTLVVPLHGLSSSTWDAIVAAHTTAGKDGDVIQDLPAITRTAFVTMADAPHWKTKPDETIDMDAEDLQALADSLTSSQITGLFMTIQKMNMPPATLPKTLIPLAA